MDFYEQTLLNYPDLMLTVLRAAAGGDADIARCVEALRRNLRQAGERPPVTREEMVRHLDHARRNLMRARLLVAVEGDRFRITERGRKVLEEHPMGVDDTVLMQFPEFRAFIRESRERPAPEALHPRDHDEGYLAFRAGKGLADNPHAFETAQHLAWENGWFQARDEEAERSVRTSG